MSVGGVTPKTLVRDRRGGGGGVKVKVPHSCCGGGASEQPFASATNH